MRISIDYTNNKDKRSNNKRFNLSKLNPMSSECRLSGGSFVLTHNSPEQSDNRNQLTVCLVLSMFHYHPIFVQQHGKCRLIKTNG